MQDGDKLKEIKSSVNLPFYHSFSYNWEQELKQEPKQTPKEPNETSNTPLMGECPCEADLSIKSKDASTDDGHPFASVSNSKLDDIILLTGDSSDKELTDSSARDQICAKLNDQVASEQELVAPDVDKDKDDEQISLLDLSSSFKKCLQSVNDNKASKHETKFKETSSSQFKPFDYEAARKGLKFSEVAEKELKTGDKVDNRFGKKKTVVSNGLKIDEGILPEGKKRQAFPSSGNRSATFR